MSHLREIGCKAFVRQQQLNRDRRGSVKHNSEEGRLAGYCDKYLEYKVVPNSCKVVTSGYVHFLEQPPSTEARTKPEAQEEQETQAMQKNQDPSA